MAKNRTLDDHIKLGHVRYISEDAEQELIKRTPGCTGDNAERLFWLLNGLSSYPKCQSCSNALTSKQWQPFLKKLHRTDENKKSGYLPFCGKSCAYLNGSKKETYKKTCIERYGVEHPMLTDDVVAKIKATNIDRYGEPAPMRWSGQKFKEVIKQKYNVENVRAIPRVHESTILSKAKTTTKLLPAKIAELENFFSVECQTDLSQFVLIHRMYDISFSWKHKCGRVYESNISERGIRQCPSCSSGTSKGEQQVMDFIRSLGIEVEHRNKSVIAPKEIDIWVPEFNLGIEYDGTYWHSAKFQNEKQSLEKLSLLENKGCRLITLQEHLWVNKPEHVKNRLASIFGKNVRLPGRKTEVREIERDLARQFLNDNHLQGYARSSVQLGLFYKDELVSVATFSKPRWAKKYNWELIRMASKAGFTVQGGPSKLISEFRKNYSGSLISYADRCWSTGNVYQQLGFKFSHFTTPSYWWIHHMLGTYARYQTQKKKLPRLLTDLKKTFSPELSEEDNMRIAGFLPLYDRGNSVWVLQ